MRTFSTELTTHLAGGVTNLCHCWKLIRRDGVTLGFTDHDRDLTFGGVTFLAGTGLEAADLTSENNLAVGGGEVSGALSAASLNETALMGGLYDDASVEIWLVNWSDVTQRSLLDVASIGEIKRADHAFIAELRGLTHRLDQERGRVFRRECDANVGDSRCGINLASSTYKGTGTISAVLSANQIIVTGLSAYSDDWFTGGKLTWTTGANNGASVEIKQHVKEGSDAILTLWMQPVAMPSIGETCELTVGCDKTFKMCRMKFNNTINFRGFPHMPGNDFVLRLPKQGEAGMDGGSLYR
jgi:uncharacterized phage protein (TIGR02218 family)